MHTQDIATIDAQGGVQIRDRLKEIVKTGGEWVDSIQLEELVATEEGVADASVIAVPDPNWGERPLAVIVAKATARTTLDIINAPVARPIAHREITHTHKSQNQTGPT